MDQDCGISKWTPEWTTMQLYVHSVTYFLPHFTMDLLEVNYIIITCKTYLGNKMSELYNLENEK